MQHHYTVCPGPNGQTFNQLISEAGASDADQLQSSNPGNSLLRAIFAHLERVRILSLVRNGSYGCMGINALIADSLRKSFDPSAKGDIFFRLGHHHYTQ